MNQSLAKKTFMSDIGPLERQQHGVVKVAQVGIEVLAGGVVREGQGARVTDENLFDRMVLRGFIAPRLPPDATLAQRMAADEVLGKRRAGAEWLARLWKSTEIDPRVIGSYQPFSTKCGSDSSDLIPDDVAWNRKVYQDMWRAIGTNSANLLQDIICYQVIPRKATIKQLHIALDALVRWREI